MEVEQQGVPDGWSVVTTTPKPASNHAALREEMLAGGERGKRGAEAYGRLTPDERKAFGEFVRNGLASGELRRKDEPIASGVPVVGDVTPEMALGVGAGVRAVGSKMAGTGGSVVAGAKEALKQVSPQIKYEMIHQGLRLLHVPEPLAIPAALAISGYQKGTTAPGRAVPPARAATPPVAAPTATPATAVAPQAVPASAPVAPATAAAPVVAPSTPAAVSPSAVPVASATTSMRTSTADLGRALKDLASKGHITPKELDQSLKWAKAGMAPETIMQNIEASRKLTGALGTPTPDQAAAAVAARNATGKWE